MRMAGPPAGDFTARRGAPRRQEWVHFIRCTVTGCSDHGVVGMAAAISFYAVLSLAPLLVIAVAIAGSALGKATARQEIIDRFRGMLGEQGGRLVGSLIDNASRPHAGALATAVGIVVLVVAASEAFGQLSKSLDQIRGVRKQRGIKIGQFVRRRLLSFAMVMVLAAFLLVSLAVNVSLAGLGRWVGGSLADSAVLMQVIQLAASIGLITLQVGMMLRFLPADPVEWMDVWPGAAVASAWLAVANVLTGQYLGRASPGSVYGAAGSLTVLLIWVYLSSLILLIGAEVARAHALRAGRWISRRGKPQRGAIQP